MSGGGGGGGGGGFDRPTTDCSRLRFDTHVASPVPAALPTLTVGEILEVILANQKNTVVVIAVTQAGQRVGGIASTDVTQLRKCLEDGFEFQAVIRSIAGAQVKIRVEPKA